MLGKGEVKCQIEVKSLLAVPGLLTHEPDLLENKHELLLERKRSKDQRISGI